MSSSEASVATVTPAASAASEIRPRRPARRRRLRALLGYLVLAALFYLPQLLGIRSFPAGDFNQHFLPFSLWQRAELLAGRLPVWNPYTYGGHPFLADVQAAVFYPVSNLLLGLTVAFASPAARLYVLEVEAGLHVVLAGFFTYLLVYEFYRRQLPAFLAGAVFAFSGYLTGYPPLQLAVLRTAVWLPLVLWLLLRAFDDRYGSPWRWTVYAAPAFTVAFLAGHTQTFLFVAYAVAAWLATLCGLAVWRARRSTRMKNAAAGQRMETDKRMMARRYPFTRTAPRSGASVRWYPLRRVTNFENSDARTRRPSYARMVTVAQSACFLVN